jgi:hypothetical protein
LRVERSFGVGFETSLETVCVIPDGRKAPPSWSLWVLGDGRAGRPGGDDEDAETERWGDAERI